MNIHAVVDYTFLYYKFLFKLEGERSNWRGNLKRLSCKQDNGTEVIDKDISLVYYTIREIEGFRKELEGAGHDVTLSICFDMPSDRKIAEEGADTANEDAANVYKANRKSILGSQDFEDMVLVEKLLHDAGHNTYRVEGYEADDLVFNLVNVYKKDFDYTVIYTPDKDLLVSIDDKVGARRYKSASGYASVGKTNFSSYLSKEFKCMVPYNALLLYLSTVGDKSDSIVGIKGFGPKAFDKLVVYLGAMGIEWEEQGNFRNTEKAIRMTSGYLTDNQIEQALTSLSMARPMILEERLKEPTMKSSEEQRESSYMRYEMKSLIK